MVTNRHTPSVAGAVRLGCAPPRGPSCASGSRGCPLRRFQGHPGRVARVGGRNRLRIDPRASEGVPLDRLRCVVCASGLSVPPTTGLISFTFEPRNSKTALFVPETRPRNSKRGFFVTFNDNLYLRNRKLLLRRCRLLLCRLPCCKLPRRNSNLRMCRLRVRS